MATVQEDVVLVNRPMIFISHTHTSFKPVQYCVRSQFEPKPIYRAHTICICPLSWWSIRERECDTTICAGKCDTVLATPLATPRDKKIAR